MSSTKPENVLITGASGGIGRACALYMSKRGYFVIGTSRSLTRMSTVEEEAERQGNALTAVELDINDESSIENAIPGLIQKYGTIDVLINNAGYGLWGSGQSLSNCEMRSQMDTNFFAPFRLMKAVLPGMLDQGNGTIINVSSILGRIGTPFNGAYAASKFALEGLSESMRVELWPFGVRVVLMEPGYIKTDFHENQVIASLSESPDLPYAGYKASNNRSGYEMLATDPIKVARKAHAIVRSKHPRFRYTINKEATIGVLCARLMPERLFQAILSRATMG